MKNAIIFDLYGTLVPNFTQSAYDPVYKEISSILDVGYDDFRKIFGTAFKERCRGKWKDIKNAIRDAAIHLGRAPTEITIERAAAVRLSFTRDSIQANNETLQVISNIKKYGYSVGLLTNCGPDVAQIWHESNLCPLIDRPVFSSDIGYIKPEKEAYNITAERLDRKCEDCIFCGDGSSGEIEGANRAGMRGILLLVSTDDVYDTEGRDCKVNGVESIDSLHKIFEIIAQQGDAPEPDSSHSGLSETTSRPGDL